MDNERFKFRAWDAQKEKMEEFDLLEFSKIESLINFKGELYSFMTIMQCTGLKDKHGKLIYEGDIVQSQGKGKGLIGSVEYHDLRATFILHDTNNFNSALFEYPMCEIIGDKFSNPELLNPSLKEGQTK